MRLIRTDGTVVEDEPVYVTPVPPEILAAVRRQIADDEPVIIEMTRRAFAGATILGPAPVGGEDEYFRSLKHT
jgi:hypothetical protein